VAEVVEGKQGVVSIFLRCKSSYVRRLGMSEILHAFSLNLHTFLLLPGFKERSHNEYITEVDHHGARID